MPRARAESHRLGVFLVSIANECWPSSCLLCSTERNAGSPEHLEPVVVWSLKGELTNEPVHVAINPSRSAWHPRYRCLVAAALTLSALHLVAVCVHWPQVFLDSCPSGMLVSKAGW